VRPLCLRSILVGGATGLLVGSLYDLDESDATESALGDISRSSGPDRPRGSPRQTNRAER
jgi:hypothetical protein